MNRPGILCLLVAALLAPASGRSDPAETSGYSLRKGKTYGDGIPIYRKEVLSPIYTIDRIYKSMVGPQSRQRPLSFGETGESEVLWVVRYQSDMVGPDGEAELSPEFNCHSNLNVKLDHFYERWASDLWPNGGRLFTLAQGQLSVELPPGFGIPVMSQEPLYLTTQALNHNVVGDPFDVRHKISIDFLRDADLPKPLKPLVPRTVSARVVVDGGDGHLFIDPADVDVEQHGPGCLAGEEAPRLLSVVKKDDHGRKYTGHWVVPPGRQVNHTLITRWLALPYDTTVHYILAHLHPFAESLELRDLTAKKTVFKATTRLSEGRIGIEEIEHYASVEGIELYKDHQYELISVYNNTSGENQDAMATMILYLYAKDLYDFYIRPPDKKRYSNR